jgi:hypothetical protein
MGEIKLGTPSKAKPGELRIGKRVDAAAPERVAPPPSIAVTAEPDRAPAAKNEVPELPANKQVNKQGYSIGASADQGADRTAVENGKRGPAVRPLTMIMLGASLLFLVLVILSKSGKQSLVRTDRLAFLNSYAAYLESNKNSLGFDLNQRKNDVKLRLHRIIVAEETGDYQKARNDLYELMLLDRDAQSPLYKQCSAWLQHLPK